MKALISMIHSHHLIIRMQALDGHTLLPDCIHVHATMLDGAGTLQLVHCQTGHDTAQGRCSADAAQAQAGKHYWCMGQAPSPQHGLPCTRSHKASTSSMINLNKALSVTLRSLWDQRVRLGAASPCWHLDSKELPENVISTT